MRGKEGVLDENLLPNSAPAYIKFVFAQNEIQYSTVRFVETMEAPFNVREVEMSLMTTAHEYF